MNIIALNAYDKLEDLKIVEDLANQCGRSVYPTETGNYIVEDYGDGSFAIEWYDDETEEWSDRREFQTRFSTFDRVMLEGDTASRPIDEVVASRFLRQKRIAYVCQGDE